MAGTAIVVVMLGLGCGGSPDNVKTDPNNYTTSKKFTVNIVSKDNDPLTYITESVPNAYYNWTITDINDEALQFYGQASNEVTITHANIGQIKVSCSATKNGISYTDTKQFDIDEHAKRRLAIQTSASIARAIWLINGQSASTDEELKAQVDKMKLDKEATKRCIKRINNFNSLDGVPQNKKDRYEIAFWQKELTNFLIHEPIIDELYSQDYPNESLEYPDILMLEKRLYREAKELGENIKKYSNTGDLTQSADLIHSEIYLASRKPSPEKAKEQLSAIQELLRSFKTKHLETSGLLSRLSEWDERASFGELDSESYLCVLLDVVKILRDSVQLLLL